MEVEAPPQDEFIEPSIQVEEVQVRQEPLAPKKKPVYLPEDTEFHLAKSFLISKIGSKHPVSLYDHMSRIVQHVLEQRPQNAVDSFEAMSFELKRNRAKLNLDSFPKDVNQSYLGLEKVQNQLKFLAPEPSDVELGEIPDMIDLARLWEWAGVSFGNEATFLLFLSIKKLVEERQLKSARLWGKINGLKSNYIIVEGELKEGMVDDEDAVVNKTQKTDNVDAEGKEKDASKSKGPRPLSREVKSGANNYPPFNGLEADYLRCQIARISAATVLSPNGYYVIDGEDGEQEDGGISNDQMASLANWTHHVPYILPQGRTVWENAFARPEGEEDDEREEDEEDENEQQIEPEVGPTLLAPVQQDENHGNIPAWTAHMCSNLLPAKFSCVTLRSNRWPGANVVAYNDKFANMYVGDGLKDMGNPTQYFVPPQLPEIQQEFSVLETSPDALVEQMDPTVDQEKVFEDDKKAKDEDGKEEGSEAGEEEEAEEEA